MVLRIGFDPYILNHKSGLENVRLSDIVSNRSSSEMCGGTSKRSSSTDCWNGLPHELVYALNFITSSETIRAKR